MAWLKENRPDLLDASQSTEKIARLRGLVDRLVNVIEGSVSEHVAGSQPDCEWDKVKNATLVDARAALNAKEEEVS